MGVPKKLKSTNYAIKLILSGVLGALLVHFAMQKNPTLMEIVVAYAAIPIEVLLFAEALDKFTDGLDFAKIYGAFYDPNKKHSAITAVLITAAFAAGVFLSILYAITGTISLSLGTVGAGAVIAAAIPSLYILLPETGDDELLLFAYIAVTIATKGQYFNSVLLAVALGKPALSAVAKVLISAVRG